MGACRCQPRRVGLAHKHLRSIAPLYKQDSWSSKLRGQISVPVHLLTKSAGAGGINSVKNCVVSHGAFCTRDLCLYHSYDFRAGCILVGRGLGLLKVPNPDCVGATCARSQHKIRKGEKSLRRGRHGSRPFPLLDPTLTSILGPGWREFFVVVWFLYPRNLFVMGHIAVDETTLFVVWMDLQKISLSTTAQNHQQNQRHMIHMHKDICILVKIGEMPRSSQNKFVEPKCCQGWSHNLVREAAQFPSGVRESRAPRPTGLRVP